MGEGIRRALLLVATGFVLSACGVSVPFVGGGPPTPHPTYKIGAPYTVKGVTYYPHVDYAYDQTGMASWYGEAFQGHYTARDPRFVTRAADRAAHNGYQKWHRDVDDEVIGWLDDFDNATPLEFETFLRRIYSRPEMRARFPHGF